MRSFRPRLAAAPLPALRTGLIALAALAGCQPSPRSAAEPVPGPPPGVDAVRLEPAEAARAAREIARDIPVQVADGLAAELWATERLLDDPIALAIDDHGRAYVTGSTRAGPLLDVRFHPEWMVPAHSLRTVEDLRAFYRRELAPEHSARNTWLPDLNQDGSRDWRDLSVQKERLLRIQDTSGDGVADVSQVMVEGFGSEVGDVAGGVLVHGGDIFLAAAPDLWKLTDTDGDGVVDRQESVSHGYNIHPAFNGHGLSGVTLGPDGRLYWSVGDIGLSVVDREGRRWEYPNQGAILRSELDGSGFEVFAAGLRNVHEFAFDEYGNLISVDNDGDHPGETERVVYITHGQDSGWRSNWQYGKYTDPKNNAYKVWMDEAMYRPRFEGQAAWFTPPVAAYHSGPAGMVFNPGTALSERWRGHFFVSEYTGSPARSRVHAFRLAEQGAGFSLAGDTVVMAGILATGMDFGPDGALYLADWIDGWMSKGTGRIWKLDDPRAAATELRRETRALLAADFGERSERELLRLLRHADQRVRLRAQMELAARGASGALLSAARQREHRLARLHGIWGLGQLARRDPAQAARLVALLRDADAEVRAQAAETLGDARHAPAAGELTALLADPAARVRFFAAEALGRIGHRPAVQPLLRLLETNDDRDVYLRHAGTLALARIGEAEPLAALAAHPSRALRTAAVVALRRMRDPAVARFLDDRDEYVATEAARAINDDQSIEAALPALARVLERERFTGEPLLRRAINANLRVGTPEAARRLAAFAARRAAPEAMRVEAVAALGVWPEPSLLDRVDGSWRGEARRDPVVARAAVMPLVAALLPDGGPALQAALADAAGRLGLEQAAPALLARVREDRSAETRVAALRALHAVAPRGMEPAIRAALADPDARVRTTAIELLPRAGLPPETAAELLAAAVGRGTVEEQQNVVIALGTLRHPRATRALEGLLDRFAGGALAPELRLDLAEAVQASGSEALRERLARLRPEPSGEDAPARFAEALRGGSAARGGQIVMQNPTAQCTRCHAFGPVGPTVGPELSRIGARLSREQLLEALVEPNARIAPGYGTVSLTLRDGTRVSGLLREESEARLVVETAQGELRPVPASEVAQREDAPSSMPPMGHILSPRQIRDVVEFLAQQGGPPPAPK